MAVAVEAFESFNRPFIHILNPTDEQRVPELVDGAKNGVDGAFEGLYGIYVNPIYDYVSYKVSNPEAAKDVTSQVFFRAWDGLPSFDNREVPFKRWLFKIARNKVIDYYRGNKERMHVSPDVMEILDAEDYGKAPSSQQEAERTELRELLSKSLRRLTSDQAQVIESHFLMGKSHKEIAEELGKQQSAIRALQHRGLRALATDPNLQQFHTGLDLDIPEQEGPIPLDDYRSSKQIIVPELPYTNNQTATDAFLISAGIKRGDLIRPNYKEVVGLTLEGLTNSEIADRLILSSFAVRARKHRLYEELRNNPDLTNTADNDPDDIVRQLKSLSYKNHNARIRAKSVGREPVPLPQKRVRILFGPNVQTTGISDEDLEYRQNWDELFFGKTA